MATTPIARARPSSATAVRDSSFSSPDTACCASRDRRLESEPSEVLRGVRRLLDRVEELNHPLSDSCTYHAHAAWARSCRMATRLTSLDGSFLRLETPNAHMHVAWSGLFEPHPDLPRPTVEALREKVAARLDRVPRFRQRLAFPPLRLAEPSWVDDAGFAVANHVTALGDPGAALTLSALRPADRRRAVRAARPRPPAVARIARAAPRGRPRGPDLQDASRARGRQVGRRAGAAALRPHSRPGSRTALLLDAGATPKRRTTGTRRVLFQHARAAARGAGGRPARRQARGRRVHRHAAPRRARVRAGPAALRRRTPT